MGFFSRVILGADESTDDRRQTYHGSAPRRDVLKHGGQSGRWAQEADRLGRNAGRNREKTRP